MLATCQDWLRLQTLAGLWQVLDRLGIHYKRARSHIHSPDPAYDNKRAEIQRCLTQVEASAGRQVLLYLDEVSTYRQPSIERAYEQQGHQQPYAERSHASDTLTRLVASLDHHTAQVVYHRASRIGVAALVKFYEQLVAAYPQAERIWVVQDNWPVHFHPDVLAALETQLTPFEYHLPKSWRGVRASAKAQARWQGQELPIQLVLLPTYASWLNPIEKLWRKLKQEVVHLHTQARDLGQLRTWMDEFMDGYATGSQELRRYVGLLSND